MCVNEVIILEKEFEYYQSLPKPELSVRARKRLNRLFREIVGSSKIPHPEVDTIYERIRSFFVRKIKVLNFKLKNHK
jgi:hypothetical protein